MVQQSFFLNIYKFFSIWFNIIYAFKGLIIYAMHLRLIFYTYMFNIYASRLNNLYDNLGLSSNEDYTETLGWRTLILNLDPGSGLEHPPLNVVCLF